MQNVSGKVKDDDAACVTGGARRGRFSCKRSECLGAVHAHLCVGVGEGRQVSNRKRSGNRAWGQRAEAGSVCVWARVIGDTPDFQNRRSEAVRHYWVSYACNDLAASDERNQKR